MVRSVAIIGHKLITYFIYMFTSIHLRMEVTATNIASGGATPPWYRSSMWRSSMAQKQGEAQHYTEVARGATAW